MAEYLNLIQIVSGVLAAALVFGGLLLSAKKLNPEKYETIPVKTTVISTLLIILGLLSYAVTKTCTNMTVVTEEHYELWALYFASLEEVIKYFGFAVFIPVLFRLFKPRSRKEKPAEEEFSDEESES